jgi:hypothetical protein
LSFRVRGERHLRMRDGRGSVFADREKAISTATRHDMFSMATNWWT